MRNCQERQLRSGGGIQRVGEIAKGSEKVAFRPASFLVHFVPRKGQCPCVSLVYKMIVRCSPFQTYYLVAFPFKPSEFFFQFAVNSTEGLHVFPQAAVVIHLNAFETHTG